MSGYTRQSAADIIPTAVVRAAPINAEFNALRDAFDFDSSGVTGHRHDGTAGQGSYVPLIADFDGNNKVSVNTTNNRVGISVEVSAASVEQVRIQDGVILPVTDNDIDLGSETLEFKNLYLDGVAKVDTLTVDENAAVAGTLNVTGLSTLASVDINGGAIDGAVIGASSPQVVTGTNVIATTGFSGTLTGNVTGNLTGNSAGTHTGAVIGNVTGNITAASGASSFNDVTINGSLDMNSGTTATITGLSTPVNATDAATKSYVDAADALKLNLSGGTMSGAIAMGSNKVTGLGTPTDTADAATKGYVDTSVSALIDSAPGTLDTLNELAAALGDDPNFATTVTNEIATKLSLSGGTMTGDISLGANKATSTATPATADTLTRKGYVDTQDALKLSLTGGTMSGAIAMGTNKITGLGNPTSAQDAATKTYVDTADATKLNLSGGTMTGNIVMGANKVTSTATPTADDDLTRKAYVDSILGSATAAADSAAAALVSETNAAGSAGEALTSANNAAASFDSFDDRYLGAKASAPTVDNDGDALLVGALYWNTSTNNLFVWTGSEWNAAAFDVGTALFEADIGVTVQGLLTAGTGISIVSDTITNDAPDQTVTLTAGTGISTSGTYPDFTITNDAPDQTVVLTEGSNVTITGTYPSFTIAATDTNTTYTAGTGLDLTGTEFSIDSTVATLTGTQTFSNKTVEGLILNDGYTEEVFAVTGTTPALSPDNGSIQTWTLSGNSTPTAGTWAAGQSITLLVDDGTAHTITWTTLAVVWKTDGGSAPTLNTSGDTVITLWKVGTTIYGARVGDA
jgi:hypothetical protein